MEIEPSYEEGDEVWVDNTYLIYDDQPGEVRSVKVEITYDVKMDNGKFRECSELNLRSLEGDDK